MCSNHTDKFLSPEAISQLNTAVQKQEKDLVKLRVSPAGLRYNNVK